MKNNQFSGKVDRLKILLSQMSPLSVAFSGGVDSTFLLSVAYQVLGERVQAIIAKSPLFSKFEEETALDFLITSGISYHMVEASVMKDEAFVKNDRDRCYVCKKILFNKILEVAELTGKPLVAHGVNLDDLNDYRPGLKAASEMGIKTPLIDAGFSKNDIREASRMMGLKSADMPSMACLASRIPYGDTVTLKKLTQIETAETILRNFGFHGVRARYHGVVARLEIREKDFEKIIQANVRESIVNKLKDIGFLHVALDLEGYSQGSLNRTLCLQSLFQPP